MKYLVLILLFLNLPAFALTGLKLGENAPKLSLTDLNGQEFNLQEAGKTRVLVFYRGSWCPYCMKQLKAMETDLFTPLKEKSVDLLAISVDAKKIAMKMQRNSNLSFSIVSDPKAESLKAFQIINKIEDETYNKYKNSYGFDLEAESGEKHHMVAHPAVYIIKDGKIIFADVHINYKERTDNELILQALQISKMNKIKTH